MLKTNDVTIYTNTSWLARWLQNWQKGSTPGAPPYTFAIMASLDSTYPNESPQNTVAVADAFQGMGWDVTVGAGHFQFESYSDWFSVAKWDQVDEACQPLIDWCLRNGGSPFHFDIESYNIPKGSKKYPNTLDLHDDLVPFADACRPFISTLHEYGVRLVVEQASLLHGPVVAWRAMLGQDRFIVADSAIKYWTYQDDLGRIEAENEDAWARWDGYTRWPTVQALALHRTAVLDIARSRGPCTVFFSDIDGVPTRENYWKFLLPDWHEPLVGHLGS